MPEVRLSEKMRAAMKRLYEADGRADFVNVWTAMALMRRNLVLTEKVPSATRTVSGQFPEWKVTLNQNGQQWCERYFAKVAGKNYSL
jgi:hypothetical protein